MHHDRRVALCAYRVKCTDARRVQRLHVVDRRVRRRTSTEKKGPKSDTVSVIIVDSEVRYDLTDKYLILACQVQILTDKISIITT